MLPDFHHRRVVWHHSCHSNFGCQQGYLFAPVSISLIFLPSHALLFFCCAFKVLLVLCYC